MLHLSLVSLSAPSAPLEEAQSRSNRLRLLAGRKSAAWGLSAPGALAREARLYTPALKTGGSPKQDTNQLAISLPTPQIQDTAAEPALREQ